MLALDLRPDQHPSPALQHPHLTYFDALPYTQSTPSPSTFNYKTSGYFDTQAVIDSSTSQGLNSNQYMTDHYDFQNPAIRIQQSSPTPGLQLPQSFTDSSPSYNDWNNYSNNGQMINRSLHAAAFQRNRSHQRAQSSSSMGSNASGSPFSQGHAPYGYEMKGQNYNSQDQSSSAFSNHLPTPTHTPVRDSFLSTSYPSTYSQGGDMSSVVAAHLAMNNNIDTHSNADEEIPGMSHSGRQSVSSMGQDPSTPRTIPDNYDEGFKVPSNGEKPLSSSLDIDTWSNEYLQFDDIADQQMRFPKLDRTVSDAYNDALYNGANTTAAPATSAPKSNSNQLLSPHRNMINEYLQAAQMARSQSPTSSGSRGVSPFRPSSPYIQGAFGQMQRPYTAASVRQAQQTRASQMEMSQHIDQPQDEAPKTISPKDAVLEYNETEEDAKVPLFSESEASAFGQQYGGQQQIFSAQARNVTNSLSSRRTSDWTNDAQQRSNLAPTSNSTSFNFATPAVHAYTHEIPFHSQNHRSHASMKQEETPEFPAHLTSMESSASEAPPSSTNSGYHIESTKPVSSTADTGTYTCTYHGCNLRFETPQKLQKHKKDGHRNSTAGTTPTPGLGSGMTSAQIAARNSQAGPHKCERSNPTTGKPCNTIFSRPYDLTRHEDTIHNNRKQKVRCALCEEEKTFSRNDALTRHMRVVHPEVDFPGKITRRRGGQD
jgi:hypothetical protein